MTVVWNKWRSCGRPGAFDFDHRKCGVGLSRFRSGRSVCFIQVKFKTKSAHKSECIDHVLLEAAAGTCHLFMFYHQSRRNPLTSKSQDCYRWCPESEPSGYFVYPPTFCSWNPCFPPSHSVIRCVWYVWSTRMMWLHIQGQKLTHMKKLEKTNSDELRKAAAAALVY